MKIAFGIEARGTTMEKAIHSCLNGSLRGLYEPGLVISSNPSAEGLLKARDLHMPEWLVHVLSPLDFPDPLAYGEAMLQLCDHWEIDLLCLYGRSSNLPANVLERFSNRILFQYPAPLDPGRPDFSDDQLYGEGVHCFRLLFERLKGSPQPWTEVVCQLLTSDPKTSPVVRSHRLEINPEDTAQTLSQRSLTIEHDVQLDALHGFATGNLVPRILPEPLISEEDLPILDQARAIARLLYPKTRQPDAAVSQERKELRDHLSRPKRSPPPL